jgi:DNA-binding response OmpR family regulator
MKTKIFVYDQNLDNHHELKEILKQNFSLKFFSKEEKLLSAIENKLYTDLVLFNDSDILNSSVLENIISSLDRSKVSFCVISDSNCEEKRMQAFELGIDDYIDKSVSDKELTIRLINKSSKLKITKNSAIKMGNLLINFEDHSAFLGGEKIPLTPLEFKILSLLVKKPTIIHSKNDISDFLWGDLAIQKQHSLDTHICNLRKKINQFNYKVKALKGRGVTLARKDFQAEA